MREQSKLSFERGSKKKRISSNRRKSKQIPEKKRKNKRIKVGSKKNREFEISGKKIGFDIVLTLVIFLCMVSPIFIFVVEFPQNAGYAMTPNLMPEQRVLVYRYGKIKRFSYVYLKVPQRDDSLKTIRRVIGLPGERIEYKADQLYINGEEKAERFLSEMFAKAKSGGYQLTEDFSIADICKEERIPEGYYLVLGDNRTFSVDSRTYGLVSKQDIIGTIEQVF